MNASGVPAAAVGQGQVVVQVELLAGNYIVELQADMEVQDNLLQDNLLQEVAEEDIQDSRAVKLHPGILEYQVLVLPPLDSHWNSSCTMSIMVV